jgi:hypothetical protein
MFLLTSPFIGLGDSYLSGCFSKPQYVGVGLVSAAWKGPLASHLLIGRGLVPGPEPQQGLVRRHSLLAPTMARDEFIKLNLEQLAAHGNRARFSEALGAACAHTTAWGLLKQPDKHKATSQDLLRSQRAWDAGRIGGDKDFSPAMSRGLHGNHGKDGACRFQRLRAGRKSRLAANAPPGKLDLPLSDHKWADRRILNRAGETKMEIPGGEDPRFRDDQSGAAAARIVRSKYSFVSNFAPPSGSS